MDSPAGSPPANEPQPQDEPPRPLHVTRAGLLGMAVLTVVVGVVYLVARDRGANVPTPVPSATPQVITTVVSDDLGEWPVTGRGELTGRNRNGEVVWVANGRGRATWPQPVGDAEVEVDFSFPDDRANGGVIVRIPDGDPQGGIEVTLDRARDGRARVGSIAREITPIVYIEPRPNDWTTLLVRVTGDRVWVDVNGQHIADWLDLGAGAGRMADKGKVALQFSDGMRFKDLQLATLSVGSVTPVSESGK